MAKLDPPPTQRPLVIEAAGGVLAPLSRRMLFADLIARWQAPVIVCGRTALGAINNALMTLEALRARNAPVLGMAFIGEENADTERTICEIGRVKRLGRLDWLGRVDRAALAAAFARGFNLRDFDSGT